MNVTVKSETGKGTGWQGSAANNPPAINFLRAKQHSEWRRSRMTSADTVIKNVLFILVEDKAKQ